jgi:hypothetical protein
MKKRLFVALNFDTQTRLALAQFLHRLPPHFLQLYRFKNDLTIRKTRP